VELAAAAPPLSYPCVRTAVRSILRARAGSLREAEAAWPRAPG
jgi:hypothetical protein